MRKIKASSGTSTRELIRNAYPTVQPRWRTLLKLSSLLTRRQIKENKSVFILSIMIWIYTSFSLIGIVFFLNNELSHFDSSPLIAALFGMGTLLVFFWVVFFPMMEHSISPSLLPTYSITAREYFTAVFLGSLFRQRSLLIILCTLVSAITIGISVPKLGILRLFFLIIGSVFSIILTAVGATFFTLLFSQRDRGFKEKIGKLGGIIFFILIFVLNLFFSSSDTTISYRGIGNILQWTPLAAPAGIIIQGFAGSWLGVALTTVISLATIGFIFWSSYRLIGKEVRNPGVHAGSISRKKKARGAAGVIQPEKILLPGLSWSPMAVVYSRAMRYLPRDNRVSLTLYTTPILGIFLIVQSYLTDSAMSASIAPLLVAAIGSVLSINDHGYDGPGAGLHILSGVKARPLLVGRNLLGATVAGYGVAVTLLAMVLGLYFSGAELSEIANSLIHAGCFSVGIIIVVSALGLVLSVFNAYAVSQPGTSPYAERSGYRAAALTASFGSLFCGWIPVLPGIIISHVGSNSGLVWVDVMGLLISVLIPVGLYLLALKVAGKKWQRDQAEIFQRVRVWLT